MQEQPVQPGQPTEEAQPGDHAQPTTPAQDPADKLQDTSPAPPVPQTPASEQIQPVEGDEEPPQEQAQPVTEEHDDLGADSEMEQSPNLAPESLQADENDTKGADDHPEAPEGQ